MLEAIIGRAGCGKTERMIERIAKACQEEPFGAPIWFIVPDHVTFAMEERLTRAVIGQTLLRVQVVSLRRLARRVLDQLGKSDQVALKEAGQYALIAAIYEQEADNFESLGQGGRYPHHVLRLVSFVTECQRHLVTASDLLTAVEQMEDKPLLQAKLRDLARLLAVYTKRTADKWMDSLELLPALARSIPQSPLFRGATVYLDGFVSFSPQEWSVIEALAKATAAVSVAIAAPSQWTPAADQAAARGASLAHPFAEADDMLTRLFKVLEQVPEEQLVVTRVPDQVCARFKDAPLLAHLERYLYTPQVSQDARLALQMPGADHAVQGKVTFAAAKTAQAEVDGTLGALIAHRKRGARWRDMAVIVPSAKDYGALIEASFRAAGVPYYMDVRRSIDRHPLSVYILCALRLAVSAQDVDAFWGLLKSDLFPLSRSVVDALENDYLQGLWKPFDRTDGRLTGARPVDRVLQMVLMPFLQVVQDGATVRQVAVGIWELLARSRAAQQLEKYARDDEAAGRLLEARLHERAWTATLSALDELVEVFADEALPLDIFSKALEQALAVVTIGAIPATLDQVLITEAARIRAIEVDHVYALGCADGAFPARVREDDLLADSEREGLAVAGVTLAQTSARRQMYERYRVYLALTRARRTLTLSCPATDHGGRGVTPSLLMSHVRGLFTPDTVQDVLYPDSLSGAASDVSLLSTPERAAHWLAAALAQARRDGHLPDLWRSVYHAFADGSLPQSPALQALSGLAHGVLDGQLTQDVAQALYGQDLAGSVSRLERFAACAFAHFVQYGLRVRDRQRLQVDAASRGTLAHDALRLFTEALLADDAPDWGTLTDTQVRERMDAAFQSALLQPTAMPFRTSARAIHEASQVYQAVWRAVQALTEHARRSAFRPLLTEVGFGRAGDPLPPLTIPLSSGRSLRLRGQIDRVDVAVDQGRRYYRIIDYKSGDKQVRLDVTYQGLELQLVLYAQVIEEIGGSLLGEDHAWAGLFYFPVRDGITQVSSPTPETDTAHVLRGRMRMRGMLRRDAAIVDLLDRGARLGETDLWSQLLKKNGEFTKKALTATESQWAALGALAQERAQAYAERIFAGDVSVNPYRRGAAHTACDLCTLQAICRFEPVAGVGRYRSLPAMDAQAVWHELGVASEEEGL